MDQSIKVLEHTRHEAFKLIEEYGGHPQQLKDIFGQGSYLRQLLENEHYHYFSIAMSFYSSPQAGCMALMHCFSDFLRNEPENATFHLGHLLLDSLVIREVDEGVALLRHLMASGNDKILEGMLSYKLHDGTYSFLSYFLEEWEEDDGTHHCIMGEEEGKKLALLAQFTSNNEVVALISETITSYANNHFLDQFLDHPILGQDCFEELKGRFNEPHRKHEFSAQTTPHFFAYLEKEMIKKEIEPVNFHKTLVKKM